MKNRTRIVTFMFALAFCSTIYSKASDLTSDTSNRKYLSIEDSIKLMGRNVLEVNNLPFVHDHFNPAARDRIVKIVYGQENNSRYDVIICNYGLIAETNDLKLMNDYFDDKSRTYEGRRVGGLGRALMNMSNRKIPGSDQLLDKILHPKYWAERKLDKSSFTFIHESDENAESAAFMEMAFFKMRTADVMKSEKVASALDEVPDGIRQKIASQTNIANYVCGIPRYKALTDNYVNVIQPARNAREKELLQERERREKKAFEEHQAKYNREKSYDDFKRKMSDLYNDRSRYINGEYSPMIKADLVREAEQFLEKVVKPYIVKPNDKKMRDALVFSMADNGVPLLSDSSASEDIDTLFKKKPELPNDLAQTQKMVQDLLKHKYDLVSARIMTFSFNPLSQSSVSEALKNPKLHADVIIVAIPFNETGDLKVKYPMFFKNVNGPFATLDSKGQPLIHLIYYRELNKWFWNPPGW